MSISPPDPLLALALVVVALGLLDRLGLWMEARGWIYWRRRRAQGSALGATFLELQKIFESGKAEHVIAAQANAGKESPDPIAGHLAADHAEIDALFGEARMAMDRSLQPEAHRALDRIWMRLAVHIRAEHKALFPAVAEARPDLAEALRTLREDHDFFMATLATAVNALKGPGLDWAAARTAAEAVQRRLAAHNALEEERIYPVADQLPEVQRRHLAGEVLRELAALPTRYGG
ncbi:MAG TPA: hemerythrin domain-containing protein [Geothrix sp.]|uniref:hemerythrin domain-containing protein n=1 Tax=Geothrix mesophila TaxID=2922723 RepID=UPI001FAE35A3|nr:hemerythrin domain-containing protein [Geothrix sp.]